MIGVFMFSCVNCGTSGDFCFLRNTDDGLEYNYCDYCGASWKSITGEYIKKSMTFKFFDKEWLGFDIDDIISTALYKENIEIGGILVDDSDISEYNVRCIRCNSPVSMTLNENGCYHCYNCGFEWGVVNCG